MAARFASYLASGTDRYCGRRAVLNARSFIAKKDGKWHKIKVKLLYAGGLFEVIGPRENRILRSF